MRASSLLSFGALALTMITATAVVIPAKADPVYTADKLIAIFAKDKEAADSAKKLGKTRKVCFESDPGCATPPSDSPTRVDLYVNFEFDSDQLTAQAKSNLAQFALALKDPKIQGTKFAIDGHTDATGTEQYNVGLSERRAAAVVAYLVTLGVNAETLVAHGYGKEKPRVPDPFSPANRRVETHLTE